MTHAICSPSHHVLECQELSAPGPLKNLDWLIRYARHTSMDLPAQGDPLPEIRSMFTAGAWRLLCRSARKDFLPILRNRELNLHSLVHYCEQLVKRSFVAAPPAVLLHFFVNQRRLYFSLSCRIPEGDDYDLIRVAARSPVLRPVTSHRSPTGSTRQALPSRRETAGACWLFVPEGSGTSKSRA